MKNGLNYVCVNVSPCYETVICVVIMFASNT